MYSRRQSSTRSWLAWTLVISHVSTRSDTALTLFFGAGLFLLLVWRHRGRELRHAKAMSLFQSWSMYQQDCLREGRTPLDFEDWQTKGRAWITYLRRKANQGELKPLDFDEWQAAGEPAE